MIRLTSESTDPTVVRVKLEVAKANDFRAAGEFNLTLRFNHDGLFACQSTSWVSVNDAYARVRDTLRKGARTPEELHKMLGIPLAAIESVLKREQFVRLGDGRYGVAARTG